MGGHEVERGRMLADPSSCVKISQLLVPLFLLSFKVCEPGSCLGKAGSCSLLFS